MSKVILVGSNSEIATTFFHEYKNIHSIKRIGRKRDSSDYLVNNYSEEEMKSVFEKIYHEEEIDAVVIFNGIGKAGKIGDINMDKIEEMIRINLIIPYTVMHCIKAIFEKQNHGHLITIGSVAGIKYSPNYANVFCNKICIEGFV